MGAVPLAAWRFKCDKCRRSLDQIIYSESLREAYQQISQYGWMSRERPPSAWSGLTAEEVVCSVCLDAEECEEGTTAWVSNVDNKEFDPETKVLHTPYPIPHKESPHPSPVTDGGPLPWQADWVEESGWRNKGQAEDCAGL